MTTRVGAAVLTLLASFSPSTGSAADRPELQVWPAAGTPQRFSVRGRVLLKSGEGGSARSAAPRNLRRLLGNEEWARAPVRARVGSAVVEGRADGEGIFDLAFRLAPEAALTPGEHRVSVEVPGGLQGSGVLRVLAPGQPLVVSDFDDTLALSFVTSKRRMLATALLETEDTQAPVPGMAELLQCLREGPGHAPGAAFLYLSGSPIQYQARVRAFLDRRGFPPGALVLRHLADAAAGSEAFKNPEIDRVLADFPETRLVLVGDSGERDPEVYARARSRAGERVLRTWIRLASPEAASAPRFEGALAFFAADEAARDALAAGLVAPGCPERVRKSSSGKSDAPR